MYINSTYNYSTYRYTKNNHFHKIGITCFEMFPYTWSVTHRVSRVGFCRDVGMLSNCLHLAKV